MNKLIICSIIIALTGCSQPEKTVTILESQGFTNVKTHGFSVFGCGKDDNFSTKFTAEKDGKTVSGVVCGGILKGSTVRFD